MTLTQGQIIQTRYRVAGLLGQGGFGAVYKGWDVNLNRPVAIKENLDTSPEAQRQFQHEAEILSNLSHPNLPRVTDHFLTSDVGQYLVMDFIEGEDLQAMLNRTGRALPEAQVLNWIDQICGALAHLHEQEPPVIHRDIKPANIKITPRGKAVLVDFGLAKVFDPVLKTTVGARAVTPGYSPPEQYGQGKTDQRSDVYSLGATLYTLLTGQEPPESVERAGQQRYLDSAVPAYAVAQPQRGGHDPACLRRLYHSPLSDDGRLAAGIGRTRPRTRLSAHASRDTAGLPAARREPALGPHRKCGRCWPVDHRGAVAPRPATRARAYATAPHCNGQPNANTPVAYNNARASTGHWLDASV